MVCAVAVASAAGCGRVADKISGIVAGAEPAAQDTLEAVADAAGADASADFAFARKVRTFTAKYDAWKSVLDMKVDWPEGETVVADSVRRWINSRLAMGNDPAPSVSDWGAVGSYYADQYSRRNGKEAMRELVEEDDMAPDAGSGSDGADWWMRQTVEFEWQNDHIVSYSYGWFGFGVGNATSSADKVSTSFRKSDGRQLGWGVFKSKAEVRRLIEQAMVEKYGDGADLYETGVPMPAAPVFLAGGIRCDYGNYSVVEAHYYEEYGCYPFCFIPYDRVGPLLTSEGLGLLGLEP